MDIEFDNEQLDRLETDLGFDCGYRREVVIAFRKRLQGIRSAANGHDLATLASWHLQPLNGSDTGACSVRLTRDFRLVVRVLTETAAAQRVRIVRLEIAL